MIDNYGQLLATFFKMLRGDPLPKMERRDDGHSDERRANARAKLERRAARRLVEHRRGGWQ